jgi:uncharacterized protein YjbI with pentapeptide repeats
MCHACKLPGEADEDTRTERSARGVGRIPHQNKTRLGQALPCCRVDLGVDRLCAKQLDVSRGARFSESGDRVKQRHYQAWQVVNTSQGKGGSGGRIEALQELNADRVPLVGVDVAGAFLQGIRLDKASLLRANFSTADIRDAKFPAADFTDADLRSANLRGANLSQATLQRAIMDDSDLAGADFTGADLAGASFVDADLSNAELRDIRWEHIANLKNAPNGFVDWALKHGAQSVTIATH